MLLIPINSHGIGRGNNNLSNVLFNHIPVKCIDN